MIMASTNEQKEHDPNKQILKTEEKPLKPNQQRLNEKNK